MTPQERELVAELFDRLARLEGAPRDPDAIGVINDGLNRAPNALYALVQTALVQDEALKRANARIGELEEQLGMPPAGEPPRDRGFLDTMRDSLFGEREPPRSSVPSAGRPMGVPPAFGGGAPQGYPQEQGGFGQRQGGYGQPPGGYPPGGYAQPEPQQGGRGGSFLGTAAAAAAGVIGGSMLLDGIRNAWGQAPSGQKSTAFDQGAAGGERSPWGGEGGGGDLGRQAGVEDIGRGGGSGGGGDRQGYGMFDQASNEEVVEDYDGDLDMGDDGGDTI